MGNALLEAALEYVARGWPVFPCAPKSKKPITAHGFKDASTDPAVVTAWWKRSPRANIGIPTGPRTFDVLDVDGPTGEQSLAALEAKHDELPSGPRQQTGTGRHILFRGGTLGVSAKRLPGLDTRGEGGYVVVAPSIHPSGERYVLEDEGEPIPEPPAWLVAELRSGTRTPYGDGQAPEPVEIAEDDARALLAVSGVPQAAIGEGQRNDALFRHGASLRARGMELDFIVHVLRTANRLLCRPPLGDEEVVRIARSAARLEVAAAYRRAEEAVARQVERERETFSHEESLRQAPSESIGESLEALRALLQVALRGVEKRGPDYYLLLDAEDGARTELRLRNLLSFEEVRRAIFDAVGCLVRVKRKDWDAAAVRLRAIARDVDPGLASEEQETLHYLATFLQDSGQTTVPIKDEDELAGLRIVATPIIHYRDEFWFLFDAFRNYCDREGLREPMRLLWRRIRETGRLREERGFRHDGRYFTRRYWVVVGSDAQLGL